MMRDGGVVSHMDEDCRLLCAAESDLNNRPAPKTFGDLRRRTFDLHFAIGRAVSTLFCMQSDG